MISVSLAVLHAVIETLFIYLEKVANKTTFMHYTIICFNGRFGWVPFTNHFSTSALSVGTIDKYFNYDEISSNLFCVNFKLDYIFTDDTIQSLTRSLTVLPMETDAKKRKTIVIGRCVRQITFENFINLLTVAQNRVNIDISNVNILQLQGAEEASKTEGFIERLSNLGHPDLISVLMKDGYKVEEEEWFELTSEFIKNRQLDCAQSMLRSMTKEHLHMLLKQRTPNNTPIDEIDDTYHDLIKIFEADLMESIYFNKNFIMPEYV